MYGISTLAHNGVLFMDEVPEFHRNALEALRRPLEGSYVTVSRTISDLEGKVTIEPDHVSEAIQYRSLDRNLWV